MEKIWLRSYPDDVPAEIDTTQYRSLVHLLEEAFRKFARRPAYVCMNSVMTYGELDRRSSRLGAWLQATGMAQGARVAVMMPNVLQYPVAVAAILRAGYTVVNVNPLYTARELAHQLKDSGAEALVVLENFAATVQQVLPQTALRHIVVASVGDLLGGVKGGVVNFVARKIKGMVPPYALPGAVPFNQALRAGAGMSLHPVALAHDDLAFLQYTGGTTGLAKGAMLSHRNVIANVLQNDAWAKPALESAALEGNMTIVCALPLYHILALTACMLMGTRWGALNLLIPNPRDMGGFVKELSRHRVTMLPGVNTLFNGLLNHPGFAKLDFSALRLTLGGGMAVQRSVGERWLQTTGTPIIEGYGLSETSPVATLNRIDIKAFTGTIGLPVPSTEIAILDEAGAPLPPGLPGEIAIRGPQVMDGYWNNTAETALVMTPDGYFKSGDIGVMDGRGYVTIVDRKKDMILVSGFNVYPNEVEAVVAAHPGVLECACVGVPDEMSGEAVKLFVVRRAPTLTQAMLMEYCKAELTGYKKPRTIEFRDALPKTNVGKILRRSLRETGEEPARQVA
ncbi:MAG TPA: long-chain-fatty-acid--CoA ligase [Burkholderiaceae bacterium]